MNTAKITLGALALGAGVLLMTTSGAFSYQGDPNVQGPNYTPERHEAMTQAFENNDYKAWKDLMGDRGRVAEVVTEQNFNRFAEMHQLRLEGNTEEADQIRQELGLGQGQMRHGQGNGNFRNCR